MDDSLDFGSSLTALDFRGRGHALAIEFADLTLNSISAAGRSTSDGVDPDHWSNGRWNIFSCTRRRCIHSDLSRVTSEIWVHVYWFTDGLWDEHDAKGCSWTTWRSARTSGVSRNKAIARRTSLGRSRIGVDMNDEGEPQIQNTINFSQTAIVRKRPKDAYYSVVRPHLKFINTK